MKLSAPFDFGEKIPSKFTCDGKDISPKLIISDIPEKTKFLALTMDDPDAPMGVFVHWVVWNIPVCNEISEGSKIGVQGLNSAKRTGYMGPCPPNGQHRYLLKLYALDCAIELDSNSGKQALESATLGHILAKSELMGVYERI